VQVRLCHKKGSEEKRQEFHKNCIGATELHKESGREKNIKKNVFILFI